MENSILSVIVLYQKDVSECPIYNSLKQIVSNSNDVDLLIFNNSPETPVKNISGCFIYNSTENVMLAKAYNYALDLARRLDKDWLLLFDQDTVINENTFFNELLENINKHQSDVIIPIIKGKNNFHISPKTYNPHLGFSAYTKKPSPGLHSNTCFLAINTGCAIKISALEDINGFDERFPLDGLDARSFWQLYKRGTTVQVMNCVIEQNLSVIDFDSLSKSRYKSALRSELRVIKEEGLIPIIIWWARIPLRAIKRLFTSKGYKFVLPTLFFYL